MYENEYFLSFLTQNWFFFDKVYKEVKSMVTFICPKWIQTNSPYKNDKRSRLIYDFKDIICYHELQIDMGILTNVTNLTYKLRSRTLIKSPHPIFFLCNLFFRPQMTPKTCLPQERLCKMTSNLIKDSRWISRLLPN